MMLGLNPGNILLTNDKAVNPKASMKCFFSFLRIIALISLSHLPRKYDKALIKSNAVNTFALICVASKEGNAACGPECQKTCPVS